MREEVRSYTPKSRASEGATGARGSREPPPPSSSNFTTLLVAFTGIGLLGGAYYAYTNWDNAIEVLSNYTNYSPPAPLLPPALPPPHARAYTLVIDCAEFYHTVAKKEIGWRRLKRPGCNEFLYALSNFYEVVLWNSTEPSHFGEELSSKVDPWHIAHHLFQEHVSIVNTKEVKDLSLLGRNMGKVVCFTSRPEEYASDENLIVVKQWKGEPDDEYLKNLGAFLEELARQNPRDMRQPLKLFKGREIVEEFAEKKKSVQKKKPALWNKVVKS